MKKERLLQISYGRLMRYIVFAYLLWYTRARIYIYIYIYIYVHTGTITGWNQHMHYVLEEFSRSRAYDTRRCYVCGVLELDALL